MILTKFIMCIFTHQTVILGNYFYILIVIQCKQTTLVALSVSDSLKESFIQETGTVHIYIYILVRDIYF